MAKKAKTQADYSVLQAWKDTQPGHAHSLHIKGMVEAPTPNLDPRIRKVPGRPTEPEIYCTKVTFVKSAKSLIPPPLRKEVVYVRRNYAGKHTEVEVLFPDNSRARLPIELTV